MATIDDENTVATQPQEENNTVDNTANETPTADSDNSAPTATVETQQPEEENTPAENTASVDNNPAEPQKIPKQETPYDSSSMNQFYATHGTPPQRELTDKEKKKAKREKIFSAIGDGLAALSNVYFTTKGAPSMYTAKNSLTDAAKKRYDQMAEARGKDADKYYLDLNNALAKDREWFRQAREDDRKDLDSGANATLKLSQAGLNDEKGNTEKSKQGLIGEQTKGQQIENRYKPKEKEAAISETKSRTSKNYVEGEKARAQAGEATAKANATTAESDRKNAVPHLTIDGKVYEYKTKEDWAQDVYKYAKKLGVDTTKMYDKGISTEEKDRDITEIAGLVERVSEVANKAKEINLNLDTEDKKWINMNEKEKETRLKDLEEEIDKNKYNVQ